MLAHSVKSYLPHSGLGTWCYPQPLSNVVAASNGSMTSPSLEQIILARFIEEGYLERHIARMKRIYRKRRDILISCLQTHFNDKVRILGDATGLHLVAEFCDVEFTDEVVGDMARAGVRVYPVERHAIRKGYHQNKIIMGYGNLTEEEIEEGVRSLHSQEEMIRNGS